MLILASEHLKWIDQTLLIIPNLQPFSDSHKLDFPTFTIGFADQCLGSFAAYGFQRWGVPIERALGAVCHVPNQASAPSEVVVFIHLHRLIS